MKFVIISLAASCALLAACSDSDASKAQGSDARAEPASPAATQPAVALGLTAQQLRAADILNAAGAEIGEVERVITDASGAVTGLLVEIEDSDPDRFVNIPLNGLTVVQNGDDQDLRSTLTREQLLAMPVVAR